MTRAAKIQKTSWKHQNVPSILPLHYYELILQLRVTNTRKREFTSCMNWTDVNDGKQLFSWFLKEINEWRRWIIDHTTSWGSEVRPGFGGPCGSRFLSDELSIEFCFLRKPSCLLRPLKRTHHLFVLCLALLFLFLLGSGGFNDLITSMFLKQKLLCYFKSF